MQSSDGGGGGAGARRHPGARPRHLAQPRELGLDGGEVAAAGLGHVVEAEHHHEDADAGEQPEEAVVVRGGLEGGGEAGEGEEGGVLEGEGEAGPHAAVLDGVELGEEDGGQGAEPHVGRHRVGHHAGDRQPVTVPAAAECQYLQHLQYLQHAVSAVC